MAANERFDLIVRARDEASAALGGITKNIGLMVGAAAGIASVTSFLKSSISAAAEAETAWNNLAAAAERHGQIWPQVEDRYTRFARAVQRETGFGDEMIAQSLESFVNYGASTSEAMGRVKIAVDFAAGAHIDLRTATDLLAKASEGYTATLSRYGIILDESIPKSERFDAALRQLNERFGGAAVAQMSTYEGQLRLLNEQWGDLKENVGGVAIPFLTDLFAVTNDWFSLLNSNASALDKYNISLMLLTGNSASALQIIRQMNQAQDEQAALDEMLAASKDRVNTVSAENVILQDQINRGLAAMIAMRPGDAAYEFADGLSGVNTELEKINFGLGELGPDLSELYRSWGMNQEQFLSQAEANYNEFRAGFESTTGRALSRVVDLFTDARASLADVFKGMFSDFMNYFFDLVLQRAAGSIFTSIFGGFNPATALAGGGQGGLFGGAIIPGLLKPGAQSSSSMSLGRVSAGSPTVVVNLNGPILGEEEHTRKVIVPTIERMAELGGTKLAIRGRI